VVGVQHANGTSKENERDAESKQLKGNLRTPFATSHKDTN
jgi:hypothetical protein